MAVSPAPEGSPAAHFAALLRHHLRVGTRPAGERGTGAWTLKMLERAGVHVIQRTLDNYCNGGTRPGDISSFVDAFFGDDPRHTVKRNAFLIAFAKATGTEPPPWANAASNIPIRVPIHFIGRDEALGVVEAALGRYEGRVAITALHGMRGVGKTTLAAAFAQRHRSNYRATWWVRAQTESTTRADLVGLGVRLGWIAADEKEATALPAVIERLQDEGEGILLIYDNAAAFDHKDDQKNTAERSLATYLPRGGAAQVLVTSNAHNWRGIAEPVELRLWPKAIGADYLIARTCRVTERHVAEALSETLGGLPLAHEQAAAYCERLDLTLAEYRQRFTARPVELLDDRRYAPIDYNDGLTVAKTFSLAIEAAAEQHPAARLLIQQMALLAPEPIPRSIFEEGRPEFSGRATSLLAGDGLDEAIAVLRGFALIERETIVHERDARTETECIRLHRLVREVTLASIAPQEKEEYTKTLYSVVAALYPKNIYEHPDAWSLCSIIDPIAQYMVEDKNSQVPLGLEEPASWTLDCLATYRHTALGDYASAINFYNREFELCRFRFGKDHRFTTEATNNLALALTEKGEIDKPKELFKDILAIRELTDGVNSDSATIVVNNIAFLLQKDGDFSTAKTMSERARDTWATLFGYTHQKTISAGISLSVMLGMTAGPEEAIASLKSIISVIDANPGHHDIAKGYCLIHVGVFLRKSGNLPQAKASVEAGLDVLEHNFPQGHPRLIWCLKVLSEILEEQGEAEVLRL